MKITVTRNSEVIAKLQPDGKKRRSKAKTILLQTLVDSGDLSSPITNPMTKDKIDLNKTITVTYDCTNKTFTYNFTLDCT